MFWFELSFITSTKFLISCCLCVFQPWISTGPAVSLVVGSAKRKCIWHKYGVTTKLTNLSFMFYSQCWLVSAGTFETFKHCIVYYLGFNQYIGLLILSSDIGLLQKYRYQLVCSSVCTNNKTVFKAWKKCLD